MIFRFRRFPQDLHRWRNRLHTNCVSESCTLEIALNYTSDIYPNISRIVPLCLCLPVGSCCCELSLDHRIDDQVKIVRSFNVTYSQKWHSAGEINHIDMWSRNFLLCRSTCVHPRFFIRIRVARSLVFCVMFSV
jgi:hypothetical protein